MNVKELLYKYKFFFKKSFGQNFLTDDDLLESIVVSSGITKDDDVIEIGCGAGTLTKVLARHTKSVTGYEIDKNLKPVLEDYLSEENNVKINFNDVMKVPMEVLEKDFDEYTVVANIPYYITTPIVTMFLESAKKVKKLVLTVQKEVADRFSAKEGTSEYGSITAAINFYGSAETVMVIGREKFTPPPKVDSAVVAITIDRSKQNGTNKEHFREVLKAAFGNRRKTLSNNLSAVFGIEKKIAEEILLKMDKNPQVRGETFSAGDFAILTEELEKLDVFDKPVSSKRTRKQKTEDKKIKSDL